MNDLTNEQKHLLHSMYKEIMDRKKSLPMEKANIFEDSNEIRNLFLPDLSEDYVADLCWSLKSKEYIICYEGDDLANDISLSDKTIIYMENRVKNGLKEIATYAANFLPH